MINYRTFMQIENVKYSNQSPVGRAIREMVRRMLYYPLVQAICRVPPSIYEAIYSIHPFTSPAPPEKYALAILTAIFTPSTGTGYLMIFLIMQPNAYATWKALISFNFKEASNIASRSTKEQTVAPTAVFDDSSNRPSNARMSCHVLDDDELLELIRDSVIENNMISSFQLSSVSENPILINSSTQDGI
jgi:hypothetical protein